MKFNVMLNGGNVRAQRTRLPHTIIVSRSQTFTRYGGRGSGIPRQAVKAGGRQSIRENAWVQVCACALLIAVLPHALRSLCLSQFLDRLPTSVSLLNDHLRSCTPEFSSCQHVELSYVLVG